MEKERFSFKNINTLDSLFEKVDLYVDLKFDLYKKKSDGIYALDEKELERLEGALGLRQESIDSYCVICEKNYPFSFIYNGSNEVYKDNIGYFQAIELSNTCFLNLGKFKYSHFEKEISENDLFKFKYCFLNYEFTCKKVTSHKYRMHLVVLSVKGTVQIRKIGQFPSKIDIWGFDFEKYSKQLNKFDAYSDFKKAELCMSDKLFAGAFTYLRRVFEKMINSYTEGMSLDDNRIETRIEACVDRFDDRVKPLLKKLYGILSIGIHELTDEQSEEYYEHLRTVIVLQLEFVKSNNEKDEQSKELKKQIDNIVNLLNK